MEEKHKDNKIVRIIIVLLIATLLFFSNKANQDKFISFINDVSTNIKDMEVKNSILIDNTIEDIAYYNDKIIAWGDRELIAYDLNGEKLWEREFNLDDFDLAIGQERIIVYDKANGDLYYLDYNGDTLGRYQIGSNIINISNSSENIIIHTEEENNEAIKIMDSKGTVTRSKLIENNNIIIFSLDESNSNFSFSTLNFNDSIESEIHMYDIEEDTLLTSKLEGQVVLYLNYINNNRLIVLTDKGLYCIDNGNIQWEKQLELIKDIDIEDESIALLYGNTFELFSYDGSSMDKYTFSEEYKGIVSLDGPVLYGSNHIIIFKNGKEQYKYETEEPIYRVIQGNRSIIVLYEERIDIIS